jgi:hypothetical protein
MMAAEELTDIDIAAHTRRWIEQFVIALELCPFAAPVLRADTLRIGVCAATDTADLADAVLAELDALQRTPAAVVATSILVFRHALADFDAYLSFLDLAEALLAQHGFKAGAQIASFHPHYRFAGAAADAARHYSKRSPYPMLHFIREAELSRALAHYPHPERIPERNIERLDALGRTAIDALLERVRGDAGR